MRRLFLLILALIGMTQAHAYDYGFVVPSTYSGSSSGGFTPFAGPGGNRPGSTSGGSLVITCPGLTSGNSYTLTYGTSSTTVSAK
ncbi:MAG: hypothetical protein MR627_07030 [Prevotella sp.]|nr:hypothetical protein [Prevotella sp.]